MNSQQFFNSFFFHKFSYTKNRHTDNCTEHGAHTNFIGQLLHGSARFVHSGNTITLAEGDVIFIPKGYRYHSYWSVDDRSQLEWNSIGFEYFPTAENHSFMLQKPELSPDASALLAQIAANMTTTAENIGLLYCFLAKILPTLQVDTDSYSLTVQRAIACMRQDVQADMATIALRCDVSVSTLYSAFRRCQSATPNEIRQALLCEKAAELLSTTSLPVEEISGKLGFSSSSYFRKILHKHTGKTPRQIRSASQNF